MQQPRHLQADRRKRLRALSLAIAVALGCGAKTPPPPPREHVRVAVIGGMMDTQFWPQLAAKFQAETLHTVELIATGPKPEVVGAYKKGGIDLIVVHASDAMINLVADGLARDPQPWVRNDMVIMGPKHDPAGIRGGRDAIAALRKIVATKSRMLVNGSHGADGVLHD